MSGTASAPPAGQRAAAEPAAGGLVTQHVRHGYWKYPIIALALAVLLGLLGVFAGSPNSPRAAIAATSRQDPGGAALAFTQELAGTSASAGNEKEFGLGPPGELFVIGPLASFAPLLGGNVAAALAAWRAAPASQQAAWANNYLKALDTITEQPMGGEEMEAAASPDYSKIDTLHGDFGPVPTLVKADVQLAQGGHLEQYLEGREPGHALHLVTIWLYDHPKMLSDAVANGLTDDQWGMVKERDYPVGPWYLIIPAIIHVKFPGGVTGTGFVLWNLLVALIFIFVLPLVPGIRSLPRKLRLYRGIARYPTRGEQIPPDPNARLNPVLKKELEKEGLA
ncbi:MAG TPA: hypothetical protein VF933_07225 [Streptosporangiaceae bacterium]